MASAAIPSADLPVASPGFPAWLQLGLVSSSVCHWVTKREDHRAVAVAVVAAEQPGVVPAQCAGLFPASGDKLGNTVSWTFPLVTLPALSIAQSIPMGSFFRLQM